MPDVFDNIPTDMKSLIALCAFGLLLFLAGLTDYTVTRLRYRHARLAREARRKPPVAPPGA